MSSWTTGKVLQWAASDFKKRGIESPRLEAEVLLSSVLCCSRIDLYTGFDRPLLEDELAAYRQTITRRRNGEPSAYITGSKEFWSLDFEVGPSVLIPRPDTETLVSAAVERTAEDGRVLDLGTGSGCVAIAIAVELKQARIHAVDISEPACRLAQRNVDRHGLSERVTVLHGDLYAPLPEDARYSAIVSNPPYIPAYEIANLDAEVRNEPRMALDGGADGLDVIRRIVAEAPRHLEPHGWLLLEIDPRQADELIDRVGREVLGVRGEPLLDLAGRKRVVAWRVD